MANPSLGPCIVTWGVGVENHHIPPHSKKFALGIFSFFFFYCCWFVCLHTKKKKKLLRTTMGTPHNPTKPLTPGELHDPFPQPRSHFHDPAYAFLPAPEGSVQGLFGGPPPRSLGHKKGHARRCFWGEGTQPMDTGNVREI